MAVNAESGICVQYVCVQQMRRWEEKVSRVIVQKEKRTEERVESIITWGVCKDKGHRKVEKKLGQLW